MSIPRFSIAHFLAFLCLALFEVWIGGGWTADAAGDPDEPAHAVTSLMLRDFVAGGHWTEPRDFAKNYYADFPKIALGHYPPFYYLIAGAVLLFSARIGALVCLQAVLLAAAGHLTFLLARRGAGVCPALGAALMTMLVPITWKLSLHVMADLLLVCLCLLAVLLWTRYEERPSVGRALAFGLCAAFAILTKGSGLMLAAVPAAVLILRWNWSRLRCVSWWCAAIPVVLLAGPWMYFTTSITREGMTGQTVPEFLASAVHYYAIAVPHQLGWIWLGLAAVGAISWFGAAFRRNLGAAEAGALALIGGGTAIILLVPAGLSERYLAPMLPALAILAMAGAASLTRFLPVPARPVVAGALAAAALIPVLHIPAKEVTGYSAAVGRVLEQPELPGKQDVWLVSSDPRGEGGVIAEAAFRLPNRSPSPVRICRASKELGTSDWMGRGYHTSFETTDAVLTQLDKLLVRWAFVDTTSPERMRQPHEELLADALAGAPNRWTLAFRQAVTRQHGVTGELLIYRSVERTEMAPASPSSDLPPPRS